MKIRNLSVVFGLMPGIDMDQLHLLMRIKPER